MIETWLLPAAVGHPLFAAAPANDGGGATLWPALLAIGVLMYFMILRPQRKEQAARRALLEAIKKNDRVVTVGGIYGIVTEVRKDADQVKLRVDEKGNVEMRFTFASIARVIRDEPADKDKADKPSS